MSVFPKDEDFWRDRNSVVVAAKPPIAVYTNTRGAVVVRQCEDDDDVVVLVCPEDVEAVCRAMLGEVGLDHILGGQSLPIGHHAPKDPTAAERQRRRRAQLRDADRDMERDVRDGHAPTLKFVLQDAAE